MYQKILICIFLILSAGAVRSQDIEKERKGIHEADNEYFSLTYKDTLPPDVKGLAFPSALKPRESASPDRMVLGWHPWWAPAAAYQAYDYNVLTHIAYFSYEVDTATGGYTTIRGWNTTPVIDYAHQKGTKVLLTVTNFGSARNSRLLSDTIKQNVLISNMISLLRSRNGDGVNLDMESVPATQKSNLVEFVRKAAARIRAELPAAEISMATPAVDWSGAWDFRKLSDICDYLIIMGYEYYWSGSPTAGPVAPLAGESYNVSRSISTYLDAGVPAGKLALGIPWYGHDWPVESQVRKSPATGKATSRIYSAAQQLAETYDNKVFDQITQTPWISYQVPEGWRQLWFEDTASLSAKYEYVISRNLAGIGIWALSYEGSRNEIWDPVNYNFSPGSPSADMIITLRPNPVREASRIEFSLQTRARVTLTISDLSGKVRMVLVDEERDKGFYSENFSAESFVNGFYFCILRTGNKTSFSKFLVIK